MFVKSVYDNAYQLTSKNAQAYQLHGAPAHNLSKPKPAGFL